MSTQIIQFKEYVFLVDCVLGAMGWLVWDNRMLIVLTCVSIAGARPVCRPGGLLPSGKGRGSNCPGAPAL